jgi:hypothetical protein
LLSRADCNGAGIGTAWVQFGLHQISLLVVRKNLSWLRLAKAAQSFNGSFGKPTQQCIPSL